ncbi:ATP-dependent DNA helicase PIF1 [Gigaspora margarita]|uniref:ATP-dependent DNA helicase PIF1 n=1 Tax=Gigaspora margarita TaxID=4874 RepID=A0A8H4ERR9_GIGMA|nr:ATP-dependent DNA helicase PIF1 [Gigaspora margarita]
MHLESESTENQQFAQWLLEIGNVSEVTNNNNSTLYPSEYLNSLKPTGLPSSFLKLKIGCPIILLQNLASHQDYSSNLTFIPCILLTSSTSELPFILRWHQFPIQLAFAITINKSQGQSVKHVGLDLRTPVFSHGQLYVALSHCTSFHNIKILLLPNSNHTLNIVYPEVILDN